MSKPNIIFAAKAEGMGKNSVMISIHRNYTDYSDFIAEVMHEGEDIVDNYDTLLISLKGLITKPFNLKTLSKLVETSEE